MLVRDEYGLDIGERGADCAETVLNGAGADARVEENFGIRGFYVYAIAG